jgi:DNA-binding MarR family transcriptional regulator
MTGRWPVIPQGATLRSASYLNSPRSKQSLEKPWTKEANSDKVFHFRKYPVVEVSMVDQSSHPSPEMAEILPRLLYYLRSRFRVGLPEDLALLRKHWDESDLRDRAEGLNKFEIFYTVGVIFSRQAEPITMGELSRTLGVPLSTATRIMDWLVKHDYARRLSDPEDRRVVRVTLTEAGQEMYQGINTCLLERVERLMRPFTTRERRDLTALLVKLVDAMEDERNTV